MKRGFVSSLTCKMHLRTGALGLALISFWILALTPFRANATAHVNPANGHSYEGIDETLTWDQARAAAAGMSAGGLRCYLATITSEDENDFLSGVVSPPESWLGGQQRTSLDCVGSNDASFWGTWITGEPWIYTNWSISDGAPDDCGEACLSWDGDAAWENEVCTDTLDAYVVECESVSSIPALSTSLLITLVLLMSALGYWAVRKSTTRIS